MLLDAPSELEVTGVYTTAGLDREGRATVHSSIDVEQIEGRRRAGGGGGGHGCADLVVKDIGDPSVDCPKGGGSCVTKVDVTIANIGTVAAGPFQALIVLDPAGSVVVNRSFGGLAAGTPLTFTVVTAARRQLLRPGLHDQGAGGQQ